VTLIGRVVDAVTTTATALVTGSLRDRNVKKSVRAADELP